MKVAIAGAGGRMGRTLIEGVLADRELELAVALDAPGVPAIGQAAGPLRISADLGALAAAVLLGACSLLPEFMQPFRIDIQQGNFVSQEMVSQLRPGMTREQVRAVLGPPLRTDIFHAERWDYVYILDRPGKPREQRHLSVFFEEGRLARLGGDVVAMPGNVREVQ